MEAIVSRMKTIRSSVSWSEDREGSKCKLRFIAISATMPNISDVSEKVVVIDQDIYSSLYYVYFEILSLSPSLPPPLSLSPFLSHPPLTLSSSLSLLPPPPQHYLHYLYIITYITSITLLQIAAWLGSNEDSPALEYSIDESHRPVRLRRVVLGYPDANSEFKFDLSLNYRLSGVIQCYSDQKPTLVVCWEGGGEGERERKKRICISPLSFVPPGRAPSRLPTL
jgi:hypothetical protein